MKIGKRRKMSKAASALYDNGFISRKQYYAVLGRLQKSDEENYKKKMKDVM